jgi:5-methylthioadenosine/S-adenosylhomocysteine deaminase
MPAAPADLSIKSRWILPMNGRGRLLERHTLVVRDGRILDLLPHALAAERYAARAIVDRPLHLLMPGLVNGYTQFAPPLGIQAPGQLRDAALLHMAGMLESGTTCFCATGYYPEESARAAVDQGLRAVIGMPVAEHASPWAATPAEYLTRALNFRDEFRGHPTVGTVFAPQAPTALSDSVFSRIVTLANELDAGILVSLHESLAAIEESLTLHGLRPIDRMQALGLLTPAFIAVHMVHVNAADMDLAARSGIAVTCRPVSNLTGDGGPMPMAAWTAAGLRLAIGSANDLWSELKLLALLSQTANRAEQGFSAWDALAVATCGGAAALGLDAEIGTLETGKWADLCCVDLGGPALQPNCDPMAQMVVAGGRDIVSDVWVTGRHLLNDGDFTRLDWPDLATRVRAWPGQPATGE